MVRREIGNSWLRGGNWPPCVGGMGQFLWSEERRRILYLAVAIGHTVLAGWDNFCDRKGEREFYALRWQLATLCWRDGAISVVRREIGNSGLRGGNWPHCVGGMEQFKWSGGRLGISCLELAIGHTVLAGWGNLGSQKGDKEFFALLL